MRSTFKAHHLGSLLLGAVGASIAACGGGVGAVPGSSDGGTVDETTTTGDLDAGGPLTAPFTCKPDTSRFSSYAIAALREATSVDYLEMRNVVERGETDGGKDREVKVDVSAGTKCANATNAASCNAAFDALPNDEYLLPSCGGCVPGGALLAFTRGNEAGDVSNKNELAAFVGNVDAPAEAWAVATAAGYDVLCETDPWIRETSDGFVLLAEKMISDCPIQMERIVLHVSRNAVVTVLERRVEPETGACIGRRPPGLLAARGVRGKSCSLVGRHFAGIARLERASVDAFRILANELDVHGAPKSLVRAALGSANDEVRHARAMARIARRYGAKVEAPRIARRDVRSLYEIALDNATEGCVRETYGALEGMWQARAANDPAIRTAMASIASDETRHGALSWKIAAWAEARLAPSERARVQAARLAEADALCERVRRAPSPDLVRVAGLPDARRAAFFADHLRNELWAA